MTQDKQMDALEARVVGALDREGLIRRERPWWREGGIAVVAAALGAAGMFLAQMPTPTSVAPAGETYLLALHTPATFETIEGDAQAREYGRWAASHQQGRAVITGGEELAGDPVVLGPGRDGIGRLAGYFLVRAPSRAEAIALARTTPHLRYGGTVVVHRTMG